MLHCVMEGIPRYSHADNIHAPKQPGYTAGPSWRLKGSDRDMIGPTGLFVKPFGVRTRSSSTLSISMGQRIQGPRGRRDKMMTRTRQSAWTREEKPEYYGQHHVVEFRRQICGRNNSCLSCWPSSAGWDGMLTEPSHCEIALFWNPPTLRSSL